MEQKKQEPPKTEPKKEPNFHYAMYIAKLFTPMGYGR